MNCSLINLKLSLIAGISPIFSHESLLLLDCRITRSFSPITRAKFSIRCSNLIAKYFLSQVVTLETDDYSRQTLSSQVIPTTSSTFSYCLFANVSVKSSQGSAIECTSSATIQMAFCRFYDCYATTSPAAGAILSNGNIYLSKCCFDNCYKNYEGDDKFANVIYCTGANFQANFSFCYQCAPSDLAGGDSTFYLNPCLTVMKTDNFSSCHGYLGGASCRVDNSPSGTSLTFFNVFKSGQYCAFEAITSVGTVVIDKWNVVNNSDFNYCYVDYIGGSVTMSNCAFVGNVVPTVAIFIRSSTSLTASNCVSDYSASYLTYNANPSTNNITVSLQTLCNHGDHESTSCFTLNNEATSISFMNVFLVGTAILL